MNARALRRNPVSPADLAGLEAYFYRMLVERDVPTKAGEAVWARVRDVLSTQDIKGSPLGYVYVAAFNAAADYGRHAKRYRVARQMDAERAAVLIDDATSTARLKAHMPMLEAMVDQYATSDEMRDQIRMILVDILRPPQRTLPTHATKSGFVKQKNRGVWRTSLAEDGDDVVEHERRLDTIRKRRMRAAQTLVAISTRLPADVHELVLERMRQFVDVRVDLTLESQGARDTLMRMARMDKKAAAPAAQRVSAPRRPGRAPKSQRYSVDDTLARLYTALDDVFPGDVEIPIPAQTELKLKPDLTPNAVARALERAAANVDGTVSEDAALAAARHERELAFAEKRWPDAVGAIGTFIGLVVQRTPPLLRAAVWRRLSMTLIHFVRSRV